VRTLIIGREHDCDIVLPDEEVTVSRYHAQLVEDHGRWGILDLQSANGSRVFRNGRWEPVPVADDKQYPSNSNHSGSALAISEGERLRFGEYITTLAHLLTRRIAPHRDSANGASDRDNEAGRACAAPTSADPDSRPVGPVRRDPETGTPVRK